MKYLLIVLALASFLTFSLVSQKVLSNYSGTCYTAQFSLGEITNAAGQLLYRGTNPTQFLSSRLDIFSPIEIEGIHIEARISPNERWIAWLTADRHTDEGTIKVHEIYDDLAYSTAVNKDIEHMYWLNDNELLTVLVPSGAWPPLFYAEAVLNPFTGEQRTVLPRIIAGKNVITDPFFPIGDNSPDYFEISPSGRYALKYHFGGSYSFYDTSTGERVRHIEGILAGNLVWSSSSDQLVFYGHDLAISDSEKGIYSYDVERDMVSFVSDLRVGPEESFVLEEGSWSPNQKYVALGKNTNALGKQVLAILDTSTGEVIETCLTNFHTDESFEAFDFAWSKDSRYLALYGLASSADDNGAIYIYDVAEGHILRLAEDQEVAQRGAIIGWVPLEIDIDQ